MSLPLSPLRINNRTADIPDWRQVGFISFPPFSESGSLGDRSWSKGDTIDEVMTLGDFQSTLLLQEFSLGAIAEMMGWEIEEGGVLSLGEFGLLEEQTIESLTLAVPKLLQTPLNRVKPIEDLIQEVAKNRGVVSNSSIKIGALLQKHPELGSISLSNLDLSEYDLTAIPWLDEQPLRAFIGWEDERISDIPGLNRIPWVLLPRKLNLSGEIALASFQPEGESGAEAGDCSSIESCLSIPAINLLGLTQGNKRWVKGDFEVKGGSLNEGVEPAGLFPFGDAFKVVLTEVGEENAWVSAYFRTCEKPGVGTTMETESCSPYSIGPVPFFSLENGSHLFVGNIPEELPSLAEVFATSPQADLKEGSGEVIESPLRTDVPQSSPTEGISKNSFNLLGCIAVGAVIGVIGCFVLVYFSRKKNPDEAQSSNTERSEASRN